MIARYLGAVLGLLAFSLASFAGLAVGNPAQTVLSRALWSLMVFCVIGLAIGMAAQVVINEYEARKAKELEEADKERTSDSAAG